MLPSPSMRPTQNILMYSSYDCVSFIVLEVVSELYNRFKERLKKSKPLLLSWNAISSDAFAKIIPLTVIVLFKYTKDFIFHL